MGAGVVTPLDIAPGCRHERQVKGCPACRRRMVADRWATVPGDTVSRVLGEMPGFLLFGTDERTPSWRVTWLERNGLRVGPEDLEAERRKRRAYAARRGFRL